APPNRAYSHRFPVMMSPMGPYRTARLMLPSRVMANRGKITQPSRKNRQRPPHLLQNTSPRPRGNTTVNRPTRAMTAIAAKDTFQLSGISPHSFRRGAYSVQKAEGQEKVLDLQPSLRGKVMIL